MSAEQPIPAGRVGHYRFRYSQASTRADISQEPPKRPYLWLSVEGPNGRSGAIRGLVDSGADNSVLPKGYIPLLGYSPATLRPCNIRQVEGSCDGHEAVVPCRAQIVAVEGIEFELRPLFMATDDPLWGRQDFLAVFHLIVEQRYERFDLVHEA